MLHTSKSITVIVNINNTRFKKINTNFKINNNTDFQLLTNNLYLGISLININNNKYKDFYILDSTGALLFETSSDRQLLLQCILKLRDQHVTNHLIYDDWLARTIRTEAARIYNDKTSKTYKFKWSTISKLAYLNLENNFFNYNNILHTLQIHNKTETLLLQSGNIHNDIEIDSSIEINKEFTNHKLKSKKRRSLLPK